MTPIISARGGLSSQAYGQFALSLAGGPSYESIATVSLSSPSASITFSSIPSTYKHLQVRAIGRYTNPSTGIRNGALQFNGDTGANYTVHLLSGNGSAASASADTGRTFTYCYSMPDDNVTANTYGAAVFDILDYANTSKYKTVRSLTGTDANGSGEVRLNSGLWLSTSAINSMTFSANNFIITFSANTQFALYGIKD